MSRLETDVRELSAIERPSASPGEEEAARWVQSRLQDVGLAAAIESFRFNPDLSIVWGAHGLAAAVAAVLALADTRLALVGVLISAVAAVSLWGELTTQFQLLRRLFPRRDSFNVLGRLPNANASRMVIVSAHHDAHRSGIVFHPLLARVSARHFGPSRDQRAPFSFVLGSMLFIAVGAAGRALGMSDWLTFALIGLGGISSLVFALVILDIARQPVSPGANDDATGVAVLLALAEAFQGEPPLGLEVWFLSTGSEEGVLGGMRAFLDQHRRELGERRPFVLNLEMLGSGRVRYVKGEGFLRHYCYQHEAVDRAAEVAEASRFNGVAALETIPFFTDALAATRFGIPALTVTSLNDDGYVPHYHWPSDTPDNLDFNSVKHAYDFCHEIIRRLDSDERKEVQR